MEAKPRVTITFFDGTIRIIEEFGLGYKINDEDAQGCIKVFYKKKTWIYPLTSIKEVFTEL